jgi:hypothetical protein
MPRSKYNEEELLQARQSLLDKALLEVNSGEEMVKYCREIIPAWLDAGYDISDEIIIPFVSIESQTDHLLGGTRRSIDMKTTGSAEISDAYAYFMPEFVKARDLLLRYLLAGRNPNSH